MSSRYQRPRERAPIAPVAPVHRGPQAHSSAAPASALQAPNAALLIDFDNVTMGIQKDMQAELRNLMSSDIIKGRVSVRRAYADWRRYPGYIVPLTEASIDLIFAPAYGSAKKNATDIRLAIDAMELVFTRPEIGTFILLSGDSDFSSLVIKLKEYGKYVIGVGIRESSSDLLVQNCDEYYSYNALAGLVRAGDEEVVRWDPWELVTESVNRMSQNGDVMRADRLKQVMQTIDPNFDEKDLGMSKFSRFVHEAEKRHLITLTRMENGQYEIGPVSAGAAPAPVAESRPAPRREEPELEGAEEGAPEAGEREPRGREDRGRGRRGRRGRGRDFERGPRTEETGEFETVATPAVEAPVVVAAPAIGVGGERLTRNEAFDVVRRAVESLVTTDDESTTSPAVRQRAVELLGRDSESLGERMFERILRDAHDAGLIDLRRRGDAYEIGRAAQTESVADQLNRAAAAQATPAPAAAATSAAPRGMGPRGLARGRAGGRGAPPPADLLSVGVVGPALTSSTSATPAAEESGETAVAAASAATESDAAAEQPTTPLEDGAQSTETKGGSRRGGRGRRGGRKSPDATPVAAAAPAPAPAHAPVATPAPAATPAAASEASEARGRGRRGGRGGAAKNAAKTATKAATPTPAPAAPAATKQPAAKQATKQPAKQATAKQPAKQATKTAAKSASRSRSARKNA